MDSPVEVADRHRDLPRSVREPGVGAWPSYYLALIELLMREPDADAYLVVQDDVLLYDRENLREYLGPTLWPGDRPGIVSLYCSSAYTREASGWHRYEERWRWGALAFVFPRELAKRFVADSQVVGHRWSEEYEGRAQIDIVIGQWALREEEPVYFPTPSLAQHIGEASSLWPRGRALGFRRADRFLGGSL
jgi:hypothetical protein